MRLLIVTQKVDTKDPILGFFHRWIEEFSQHCEQVIVIGQSVGEHAFPSTVSVFSLGKEEGVSLFLQVVTFWKLLWKHRKGYDRALVHMTPIWVVLGSVTWTILRKPMYLWYEARGTRWPLYVALHFVRKVFSASRRGMPVRTSKSMVVGHGIDTQRFTSSDKEPEKGLLVTVGRTTRAKHLDVLIRMMTELPLETHLTIIGGPITHDDNAYLIELRGLVTSLSLKDRVTFGTVIHDDVAAVLQRAELFVHASETPLDKALLEAMAAGCIVLTTNEAAKELVPEECFATEEAVSQQARTLLALPQDERSILSKKLRTCIEKKHSLPRLVETLVTAMH